MSHLLIQIDVCDGCGDRHEEPGEVVEHVWVWDGKQLVFDLDGKCREIDWSARPVSDLLDISRPYRSEDRAYNVKRRKKARTASTPGTKPGTSTPKLDGRRARFTGDQYAEYFLHAGLWTCPFCDWRSTRVSSYHTLAGHVREKHPPTTLLKEMLSRLGVEPNGTPATSEPQPQEAHRQPAG
jgi:hypothetical protein